MYSACICVYIHIYYVAIQYIYIYIYIYIYMIAHEIDKLRQQILEALYIKIFLKKLKTVELILKIATMLRNAFRFFLIFRIFGYYSFFRG